MVMIEGLIEHDVFDLRDCRAKDFVDWFDERTQEEKDDLLHNIAYGLEDIKSKLYDCLEIAKGDDYLNEPPCGGLPLISCPM